MIGRASRWALAALVLVACSGSGTGRTGSGQRRAGPSSVPARANTAGDVLLAKLPYGADSIVELDLARLRSNSVVGTLATSLMQSSDGGDALGLGDSALDAIDLVVFVSYDLGSKKSGTLTVVRGAGVNTWRRGHRMDATTVALGDPALLTRLRAVARGAPSLAQDWALLGVRTRAMPEKARAATVRVSARLGFDARVSLAAAFRLDEVPASVSVWGDVVDDLAVVGLFGATSPKEAARLTRALGRWRNRVAGEIAAWDVGLGFVVRRTVVERRGAAARALLHIGPRRLARYVSGFASRAQTK